MADLILRAAAIEAFDDERVDRNYGDVSPESVIKVIESIPAVDAVPIADAKAIVDIALYAISKMENFGCAYVWMKSSDPYADENNIRGECQEYRRKIKDITGRWCCGNGTD